MPDRSARSWCGQLRVGDQQLIEIAKALSLATGILIMDEPTSALTESEVARLFRVIERLRAGGVTVLYISHKMDEVFRLADRIAVLRDGRLVDMLDRRQTDARAVTHLMVGREIEETDLSSPRQPGETVLGGRAPVASLAGTRPGLAAGGHFVFAQAGRDPGHRRADGRGADRVVGVPVRRQRRPARGTHSCWMGATCRFSIRLEARQAGVALVTEDRKRLGLFAQMSVGQNITLCTLEQLLRRGLLSRRREDRQAATVIAQLGVKTRGRRCPDHQPQRRQSAKGDHRPLAADRAQGSVARRPDARHRRGRQSRAVSPDGSALPPGAGHHRSPPASCPSC